MATDKIDIPVKVHEGMRRREFSKLLAEKGFTKGAEIGVRSGQYSKCLCEENPKLELISVDPYDLVYQDVRSNRLTRREHKAWYKMALKVLDGYNAKLIRKTSIDVAQEIENESLDFVYIDGSHQFEYVMTDIIMWGWKVKKGGIISGHDYYKFTWGDVVRAVDNYAKIHGVKEINLTSDHTPSWWFERTW